MENLNKTLAFALIAVVKETIAADNEIQSIFMGLEIIQKFHVVPLSVVETFERCAVHASEGREEQATTLLSTIRQDVVNALGRVEEQMRYLERLEAAMALVAKSTQ